MRSMYLKSFALLIVVGLSSAMAFGQAAVDTLKSRLVNQPVTLNLPDLRLSRLPHAELKVVGGVPRPGMLNLKLDTDEVAHQNDTLTVRNVEGSSEKKNDFLRIAVATASGASAKLAFQFDKGALASMDEGALEQAISRVIAPQGAAPPARTVAGAAGSENPMAPIPPPPPPPDAPAAGTGAHSSKKLDLPPATPGYPAMHAKEPAPDGCWYDSYSSAKFNVEFAYPQCPDGSSMGFHVAIADGSNGPVARNTGVSEDVVLFTVYAKQSDETLRAAVKRVIIDKFKDPAARLACKATDSSSQSGQKTVEITATGPYAKRRTYPLSKNGLPCDGLTTNDDGGDYPFVEFPSETKTIFIMLPDDKGSFRFPAETIHFSSTAGVGVALESKAAGDHMPPAPPASYDGTFGNPVRGAWVNQPAIRKNAVSADANTIGQTDVGLSGNSQPTAIAIGCLGPAASPHVEIDALVPAYPGYTPSNVGTAATLLIGKSRRDVRMQSDPLSKSFVLSTALTPEEIAQINQNDLTQQGGISILFFAGASRAVTTADLPEANAATDKVMQACHVPLISHAHVAPFSAVTPAQMKQLQLVKVALGMSQDQVKAAIGAGYRFSESPDGNVPSLRYLLAFSNTTGYTFSFVNGSLQGFVFVQAYFPGSQPLVTNLIDGIISKTWQPTSQTVNEFVRLGWGSDVAGRPITKYNQSTHPGCSNIGLSALGSGGPEIKTPSHMAGLSLIRLADAGPDCGVAISLSVTRAKNDPALAESLDLAVSNQEAFRTIVHDAHAQQQQQIDAEHKKAGDVPNPFTPH